MMLRRRPRLWIAATTLALASAGVLGLASVHPVRAESLATALSDTYRNNPTLRAARAQLRATNERVPQELSNWRPQVSIDSSISRQSVEDEDRFSTTNETTTPKTATLRVQQSVYRGGQTAAGRDRAEFEVESERARVTSTEQDVLQRALEAYLDVWRDREILRLNTENVKALQEQLNAARERFKRGVATRTDVAQAETRLSRAKARRENTRGQLTSSRAVYEEIVGHPPGELTYPDNTSQLPSSQDGAVAQAAANNPQVLAAVAASRAADREVRQRTGQLLPRVTLTGELSRREESLRPSDETSRAEMRLRLQVPLYQGGQVTSQVRQAKQTASQRRLETAESERRARQQARSAWGRLEAARNQIEQRRTQVETARIALTGMEEELNVGSRTVIEVLDAEQDLFNAQIGLVRAQRDIAVARFGVMRAVGTLTARDLGLDVELYDPAKDYEDVRDTWWGLSAPGSQEGEKASTGRDGTRGRAAPKTTEAAASAASASVGGTASASGVPASAGGDTGGTAASQGTATEGAAASEETGAERAASDAGAAPAGPLSREELQEVEQLLSDLKFGTGRVDGRVDPATRAAIGQFQNVAGLPITHAADSRLLEELRAVAAEM